MFGIIGEVSDANAEIIMVQSVTLDSSNNPVNYFLVRGCLDTIPRTWPSGTPIYWLSPNDTIYDPTVQVVGHAPLFKLQTRTGGGTLALSAATTFSSTVDARPHRPTRPAHVSMSGIALTSAWHFSGTNPVVTLPAPTVPTLDVATGFPILVLTPALISAGAPLVLSWANRNRLVENTRVLFWDDADVTGESGQTVRIRVTNFAGVVLRDYAGLTGTSYSIPLSDIGGYSRMTISVYAENAGLLSLQAASFIVLTPHISTVDSTMATIDSTLVTVDAG
jgi:hypothetical protein